jgi:hypothetical protein
MTLTELEKYRETIEAAGWDFDSFCKVLRCNSFVGADPSQIAAIDFVDLAHSRGERIKELEKEIEKLREAKYPW